MSGPAADVRTTPYWWDAVPRPPVEDVALPARADVVVVGSGYAGLSAAIQLARAGRSVCVLEARSAGFGASSRSVGMIGGRLRLGYAALAARFGGETALAMMREARGAYDWFLGFVGSERIACDLVQSGRLVCSWTSSDLDNQKRLAEFLTTKIGIASRAIGRADLASEIDTSLYHGALLLPDDGGVDPAKYHEGLLQVARTAGVNIICGTRVEAVSDRASDLAVNTSRGGLAASEVILATNAYTTEPFSWFRRRVIPVGSQMAATAPIDPAVLDRLIPRGRLVNDTRQLAYAIRRSPDRSRLLIGGRALTMNGMNPGKVAKRLARVLTQVFPQLAGIGMTHAWDGPVGFTFDRIPHIGRRGRLHYVLGCNGSGIVMSSYLGAQVARLVLDRESSSTFANRDFPTMPLYSGRPWFMPPMTLALGARDAIRRWTSS